MFRWLGVTGWTPSNLSRSTPASRRSPAPLHHPRHRACEPHSLAGAPAQDVANLLIGQTKEHQSRRISAAHVMQMFFPTIYMADLKRIAHFVEAMAEAISAPALTSAVDQHRLDIGLPRPDRQLIEQFAQAGRHRNDRALPPSPA